MQDAPKNFISCRYFAAVWIGLAGLAKAAPSLTASLDNSFPNYLSYIIVDSVMTFFHHLNICLAKMN